MPDYHAMYLKLFGAQADAIETLTATTDRLVRAHQEVEEMVMSAPEPDIKLLKPEPEE